jgi:hypothetical protein
MERDENMAGFADYLEEKGITSLRRESRKEPLWKGPEVDGVTFSLLSKFLFCRERFRLYVVEGLKSDEGFNHRLGYGNMWHVCEESHASNNDWRLSLKDYVACLCNKYKTQQEQVLHWYNICKIQFPVYVKYWENHPDVRHRQPLLSEEKFCRPYKLPSGRTVYLRGKWDSVDLVTSQVNNGVWLQENKTKADIRPELLRRQLTYDMQTMMYVVALDSLAPVELGIATRTRDIAKDIEKYRLKGVRYNIVRRPLGGGKHTIKPYKATKKKPAETMPEFYMRLKGLIEEDAEHFFMRFNVSVKEEDIVKFKRECLNPILEQLCDWWQYIRANDRIIDDYSDVWSFNKNGIHYRTPFGLRLLEENMTTDLDEYMSSGSTIGLQVVDTLFPELVD